MESLQKLIRDYRSLDKQIYFIFISKTVNAMGALVFPFLTLLLREKVGLSKLQTGSFITVSGIIYALASMFGGRITDKLGRKKIIIISEISAIFCYISCMFMQPSMAMAYLLLLAGAFFGIAGPAHDAMVADLTTTENRQAGYSLTYLGFNLGFAFSQLFAGYLFKNYLYMMFLIDGITALLSILIIGIFVKETIHRIDDENQTNELEEKVSGSIFKVLLSRPILIYFALAAFGYKFVYSQWTFMIPMHALHNFPNEGAKLFGKLGAFNAIIVVIGTPIITFLTIKKSNIKRVFYAGIMFTFGFGLLGFISVKGAFFASVFIFTLGEILEAISAMPFIMNHTPASHRGRVSSILPIIMGAGYAIGPLVMGAISEFKTFEYSWKVVGLVALVATILMKILEKYDTKKTAVGTLK